MKIRKAVPNDLTAIESFACFDQNTPTAIDAGCCYVAESDGGVMGYVIYAHGGLIGRDFIKFLGVERAYRRRGAAVALLRAAEAQLGPGRLFISTEVDNSPMLALLSNDGWVSAGEIRGINDGGQSELFFYKDLPPDPV